MNLYNVGDVVYIRKGYTSNRDDDNYGGAGYIDDDIPHRISSVNDPDKGSSFPYYAYFFYDKDSYYGVFEYALLSIEERRNNILNTIGIEYA